MLTKSAFVLAIILLISLIIASCCKETFKITSQGTMYSVVDYDNSDKRTDIINRDFILVARFTREISVKRDHFSLFNSAYATTCAKTYLNQLRPESFVLTIDSAFIFNSDTISTTKNLLDLPGISKDVFAENGIININFTQDFINQSGFSKRMYTFQLTGETSDDIHLSCGHSVYMDL